MLSKHKTFFHHDFTIYNNLILLGCCFFFLLCISKLVIKLVAALFQTSVSLHHLIVPTGRVNTNWRRKFCEDVWFLGDISSPQSTDMFGLKAPIELSYF